MSEERPWEDYGNPVPSAGIAGTPSEGADWADIGKGAVGGLSRGVTGLLGTAGTLGELYRAGLGKMGVPENVLEAGARLAPLLPGPFNLMAGPSGRDIQSKVEERTGKFYEPKTLLGQYASTAAEFAPGAALPGGGGIASRIAGTLLPAVASETAGQATKGTEAEPWARGIAGLAGGVVGGRAVTPTPPPTAARRAAVNTLEREGVPLFASERTGSPMVRQIEAVAADMPFSAGATATRRQAQDAALNQAVTRRMFDPAELERRGLPPGAAIPDPDVMAHGRRSLSDEYNRLSRTHRLQSDPQFIQDMYGAEAAYNRSTLPSQRATGRQDLEAIRNDIVDRLLAGGGQMPGDVYQSTRSRLGTQARAVEGSDPYLANAFRDYRGALDRAMQRGLPPDEARAWALNNTRWGNMRQLEGAIAASPENLSPAKLAQGVRAGRAGQAAQGAGDMDELARAANLVIRPFPSSGTAQRTAAQNLWGLPSMLTGGGGVLGSMLGPVGAVVGAMAPHLATRAVMSGAGQRYLSNQAAPQTGRNLIAQTLAQQAASQPSGVERNREEVAANNRKRQQRLRELGLQR